MSVKMILDDAAVKATVGLRIDLPAAQREAGRRRARLRHQASAAMAAAVAVAAVAALMVVLLPGSIFRASTSAPAAPVDAPIGLPDHWYYAPPWTPPVTRHPMATASMMLAVPLQSGWSTRRYDSPVLVSADGTDYASVPWGRYDTLATLAPDGRDVGWVTQTDSTTSGPEFAVVHRIRLADGRQQDVRLPKGARVERLRFDGGQLIVGAPARAKPPGWSLALGSTVARPLAELPAEFAEGAMIGHADPGDDPEHPGGDAIVSSFEVHALDGQGQVEIIRGGKVLDPGTVTERTPLSLMISGRPGRDQRIPITGTEPVTDAQILGWAEAGIVVRIHTRDSHYSNLGVSVRIFPVDGSPSRIAARRVATLDYPVAVAVDVVGAGVGVPGVRPTFPERDRTHLRYLVVQGWRAWHSYLIGGSAVALALGSGFVVLRSRRRRVLL